MKIPSDSLFATHPLRVARQQQQEQKSLENSFLDMLTKGINGVNDLQMGAGEKVDQLLSGKDINSAEVLTEVQKADMSFKLLIQIRNKLMKAFDELNNIRV